MKFHTQLFYIIQIQLLLYIHQKLLNLQNRYNFGMIRHGLSQTKIKKVVYKNKQSTNSDRLPILSIKNQFLHKPTLLTVPKPKYTLPPPLMQKSLKKLRLIKQINPKIRSDSNSESSQSSKLISRLQSGQQSRNKPELTVLKLNKDKHSYLKKPYILESLVGQQAIQNFYQRYKQIDRRNQKEDFMNEKHAITKIINLLQLHNFTPRRLTLVKLKGKEAILDLKKLGLGQGTLGPVIAQIVNYLEYFQEIDLSYNRIDGVLGQTIIEKLGNIKKIDLSHNRIGKIGCQKIAELMILPHTKIQELNLQQNNLLDNAGVTLLQQFAEYNNLKKLNLNKNYMGSRFALKLKQIITCDKQLNELYLSWNEFSLKSTQVILQGVAQNINLKVFDFSWNKIEEQNIPALAKIFQNNKSLRHVDFSFCQIRLKSINTLAKALKQNHNIYGLHLEGNSGYIDHRGFLNSTQKQFSQYPLPLIKGIIRKIDGIKPNLINQYKSSSVMDVCWICQSWQQKYFDIAYEQELQSEVNSINGSVQCYIHFKHQNFRPVRMMMNDSGNRFQVTRMCPVEQIYFFFTFLLSDGTHKIAISHQYHSISKQVLVDYYIGKISIKQTILSQNRFLSEYQQNPLNQFYEPKVHIVPRFLQVRLSINRLKRYAPNEKQFEKKKQKLIQKNQIRTMIFQRIDRIETSIRSF